MINRLHHGTKNRNFVLEAVNCNKLFLADKIRRKFCSKDCYDFKNNRKKRNRLSFRTFLKILKRAFPNWKCPICDWSETFNVHHINPRRNGGTNELNNLIMICPNHHSLADNGRYEPELLKQYAINQYYSEKELIDLYYNISNKK